MPPVVRNWRLEVLIWPWRWARGRGLLMLMSKTGRMAFRGVCAVVPASTGNVTGVNSGHDARLTCRRWEGHLPIG